MKIGHWSKATIHICTLSIANCPVVISFSALQRDITQLQRPSNLHPSVNSKGISPSLPRPPYGRPPLLGILMSNWVLIDWLIVISFLYLLWLFCDWASLACSIISVFITNVCFCAWSRCAYNYVSKSLHVVLQLPAKCLALIPTPTPHMQRSGH